MFKGVCLNFESFEFGHIERIYRGCNSGVSVEFDAPIKAGVRCLALLMHELRSKTLGSVKTVAVNGFCVGPKGL